MDFTNFTSKTDDVVWLAYQLKNKLGSKISINKIGIYKENLEGRYLLDGYSRGIDFNILYSDNEFLRICVGESYSWAKYEDKLTVLNEIKNTITNIKRNNIPLGEPTAFYNIPEDNHKRPCLEYIYADKEEYIKSLENNTLFDDGGVVEDLIIFDKEKERENIEIRKYYFYDKEIYGTNYSILIDGVFTTGSNIDLKSLIEENLDNLFKPNENGNKFDILKDYVLCNNDIVDVINRIRKLTSLVNEKSFIVSISKGEEIINMVCYKDGKLCRYISKNDIGEGILDTSYTSTKGIKFETTFNTDGYDLIQDFIRCELEKINDLKDIENTVIKNNDTLLKLVRRMGNK